MWSKAVWLKLEKFQKNLDQHIFDKHHLNREVTLTKRQLSFLVEMCEFVNVGRYFKYWSVNHKYNNDELLEEYIDALHFLMSLGIDLNVSYDNLKSIKIKTTDFTKLFLDTTNKLMALYKNFNVINYQILFNYFVLIGDYYQFKESDILKAYKNKHQTNFKRQANNY